MKRYTILICVLAVIALGVPSKSAHATGKLGPALQAMKLDKIHQNADRIPVLIRFNEPCVIQRVTHGGRYATSTFELNKPTNLKRITALSLILANQRNSIKTLEEEIEGIEVLNTYQLTTNSVSAMIPREAINKITEFEFVTKVFYRYPVYPQRWHSRTPLNCWSVYNGETDLDGDKCLDPAGRKVDGTGIVCAVTDSGVDYTHPDFGSQTNPEGDKVVISHDFADSGDDCQEIIFGSHGTCCAGIIAGDGPGEEKGIAPKALLAGYKIAGPDGSLSGDVYATWEIMVEEGVDVSNNSYGAPRGYSNMSELQNNAVLAGVSVVAGQGNWGTPGPNLPIACGSASSPPNVISVGATQDYAMYSKAVIKEASSLEDISREFKGIWGETHKEFNDFCKPVDTVDCLWGRRTDFSGLNLNGKVALMWKGPCESMINDYGPTVSLSDKLTRAHDAGAIAVILYNDSPGFLSLSWYDYSQDTAKNTQDDFIPCLEMLESQGKEIRRMLHEGNDWEIGEVDVNQNKVSISISEPEGYGNITSFTSQGPTINGTLKPDVCAPGERIRTTYPMWVTEFTDYFGDPPYTDDFGGTSAAGPFVCGVACLIRQARPEWDPFEVKRALMNTATPLRRYIDDEYIPFLSQGMGRANAFDACMTDVLIQPPSALMLESKGVINIDDLPEELSNRAQRIKLPKEIQNSEMAFKVYNYDKDASKTLTLSYEVNSRQSKDIKVKFTSDTVSIPVCTEDSPHSHAWIGIDIEKPSKLTGGTNDIFVWFTDESTGQRWHAGICIYSGNPETQGMDNTYVGFIEYLGIGKPPTMTPNFDGAGDGLEVNYTMTNGAYNLWLENYPTWPYYSNFAQGMTFLLKDFNGGTWQSIHTESVLEPGEHSFSWDGLDDVGACLLPDGEWFLGIKTHDIDGDSYEQINVPKELLLYKNPFQVSDSVASPLPTVSAYALPVSPGKGSDFTLGIYIKDAVNLKSIQFNLVMHGIDCIAEYRGYEKGSFMEIESEDYSTQGTRITSMKPYYDVEFVEDSDKVMINIQRHFDGVSGDGWLLYINLHATASNYLDILFDNLRVTCIDEETLEEKEKLAFYNTSYVTIVDKFFQSCDFNRDGVVNEDDLSILTSILGIKKGEKEFNWRCDLNRDQIIDMKDVTIFARAME